MSNSKAKAGKTGKVFIAVGYDAGDDLWYAHCGSTKTYAVNELLDIGGSSGLIQEHTVRVIEMQYDKNQVSPTDSEFPVIVVKHS